VLQKAGEDQLHRSCEKWRGRVKEERNILLMLKIKKVNWIGHILRRNCLLKHVIERKIDGRIEMTRRWGWRGKQLQDDRKQMRGYWKLKEEALDRALWRTRFGWGYGLIVRQTTEWMNEWINQSINESMNQWMTVTHVPLPSKNASAVNSELCEVRDGFIYLIASCEWLDVSIISSYSGNVAP
jgi:hypothetical protein